MPKLYAVIVKCDRNFFDFLFFNGISSVLVSGMEGAKFRPHTLEKHEFYHMENEEWKIGVLRKNGFCV